MKEKLKYIPFHAITALPLFGFIFLMLVDAFEINTISALIICFAIYVYDVLINSKFDYLEDKVKRIEEQLSNKG